MRVRDLEDEKDPGTWAGLSVRVDGPSRPRFRVEFASPGFLRITHDARPILWCRLHGAFADFSWLRARDVPRALPPISASVAREAAGSAPRWARLFASMLADSGVLHRGEWRLEAAGPQPAGSGDHQPRTTSWAGQPVRAVTVSDPERALERLDADRWGSGLDGGGRLLGLRGASPPDSSRVKALRKLAREGVLPPLVLCFVTALDCWILLDGHDRLLAATLEGIEPRMLSVSAVREERVPVDAGAQARLYDQLERRFGEAGPLEQGTAESLDATFLSKFPPPSLTISRTRAWPIPGGRATWLAEVQDRLRTASAVGPECRLAGDG